MTTIARAAALAALLSTTFAAPAAADFLVQPFFAWSRNPGTDGSASDPARWRRGGGASAEMTFGWFLVGGDVGYAAGFFEPEEDVLDLVASSHVLTIVGHAGIGMPARRDEDRYFPYVTGGFGWMRQDARDREGLIEVTRNDPAVHVGGGVRVLFTEYLGVRADVRYFRSMRDPYDEPDPIVADLERLSFWRIGIGAVVRFGSN